MIIQKQMSVLSREYALEHTMLKVLGAVIVTLILCYVYLIAVSVLNVMARREALQKSDTMQSMMGEMEQQYFALSTSLDPARAQMLGLSPLKDTVYVYRTQMVGTAIRQRDEI